jgi:hypothetical protein
LLALRAPSDSSVLICSIWPTWELSVAWDAMHSLIPSSLYSIVYLLILPAPRDGQPKLQGYGKHAYDWADGGGRWYYLIASPANMWESLNHESNIFISYFKVSAGLTWLVWALRH